MTEPSLSLSALVPGVTPASLWVWFDLDDTLWDFSRNSPRVLRMLFSRMRLSRFWADEDAWIHDYHIVNDELWGLYARGLVTQPVLRTERFRRPLASAGCHPAEAASLAAVMDTLYLDSLALIPDTVPGAIPLLSRLRDAGCRIGILSNGFHDVQHGKMRQSGIDRLVDLVVLSDEIGINKPDSRLFDYAARKAAAVPSSCIMVGDNPDTDVLGALRAGWAAVWFNPHARPVPTALSASLPSAPAFASVASLSSILP